ncbi:MAG: alpha/beta fold hydrolase [bacterium]
MGKKSLKILFFLSFLTNLNILGVIILVHGSFASNSQWYSPRGNFFQELETQAKQFDQKVIPFSWSGQPNNVDIIHGAESLAKVIESYPENEQIILIGHSHGGNVINYASTLLYDPFEDIMQNQTTEQIYTNVFSLLNQIELQYDLTKTFSSIKTIKNNSIEAVYLLGTPVDTTSFAPNMRVIKNLYSFYSDGDNIQTVLGAYQQKYSGIEHVTNLKITMKNVTLFSNNPGHVQMHDPVISKWILHIPDNLKKNKVGNFENFEPEKNATIFFDGDNFPEYKI